MKILDDETRENQLKLAALNGLETMGQSISKLIQSVKKSSGIEEAGYAEIMSSLKGIRQCLNDDIILFKLKDRRTAGNIEGDMGALGYKDRLLSCMETLLQEIEEMDEEIKEELFECNACGGQVFFSLWPSHNSVMQKRCGFLYWNADYFMLNRKHYKCPVCKAADSDRIIIAFLEHVKPERGETLRMLQLAPSDAIRAWAEGRSYVSCCRVNSDIAGDTRTAEEYDIIVCSNVLERVRKDDALLEKLFALLKDTGVMILVTPLPVGLDETDEQWGCAEAENWRRFGCGDSVRIYSENDLQDRLKRAGFLINRLDENWFGREFYRKHGFSGGSGLYALTKKDYIVQVQEPEQSDTMKRLADLEGTVRLLKNAISAMMITSGPPSQERIQSQIAILAAKTDNARYELSDKRCRERIYIPEIMTAEDTIESIITRKRSIARFGDGEFAIMCGYTRWRFQRMDEKLSKRLKEAVQTQDDRLLIGLNDFYGDLSARTEESANGIRMYLNREVREEHYKLLEKNRVYANALISRIRVPEDIEIRKRMWEGRDCVFIEGSQTRMGVGNDLFDNAASVKRILCPAENAFDRYDDIYHEALRLPGDVLILIALGPTASVLAYDLSFAGYQALDIGHVDLSYEWVLRGKMSGAKVNIPHKYCNEVENGYLVEDICDEDYQSQILADFH